MKKRLLALLMMLAMTVTLFSGCGNSASSQAPGSSNGESQSAPAQARVLKLSLTANEASPTYEACMNFAEDVAKRTNNSLKVEVYANTSLAGGNQTTAIEMCQQGTIEIALVSGIVESALIEDMNLTCVPWIWESNEMLDKALIPGTEVFSLYEKKFADKNLVLLGFAENGFRQLTNDKHAVKNPEDLKNLKIRVLGNQMLLAAFKAMGANPTDVNFNELFTAMQQGAVDGQENPVSTIIVPQKYEEVQKYMTVWNYSYDAHALQMGQSTWKSLTAEQQTALQEAGAEFSRNQRALARESYEEDIKYLKEYGMEIHEPSEEELAAFKAAVAPVVEEYVAKYDQDIYNAILACKA